MKNLKKSSWNVKKQEKMTAKKIVIAKMTVKVKIKVRVRVKVRVKVRVNEKAKTMRVKKILQTLKIPKHLQLIRSKFLLSLELLEQSFSTEALYQKTHLPLMESFPLLVSVLPRCLIEETTRIYQEMPIALAFLSLTNQIQLQFASMQNLERRLML